VSALELRRRADADGATRGVGTAIVGAGPAGLAAAYVLARRGARGVVFEAGDDVGGIARTVEHDGCRFDLGGHRFFTKVPSIERLWEEMLGDDFLTRPRLSRIYYDGRYFQYPLQAREVLSRLGVAESARCALSYVWALRLRRRDASTFEDWVTTRFGRRLYEAFFRSYTEKVWGIPGTEIRALWAAQRIKDFSFWHAVLALLGLAREDTTLIERFRYPRRGPGQMWRAFARLVEECGVPVRLEQPCLALEHDGGRVTSVLVGSGQEEVVHEVENVVSTMALQDLVRRLRPAPPPEVLAAAAVLRYRALLLVALITTQAEPFPDNWVYIHDPGTRAGRVQNYGAWSPDMVRPGTTCLGVEYFCFEGDDIWSSPDERMIDVAARELAAIGLIDPAKVVDGACVRVPNAYPVYDSRYEDAVAVIRSYVEGFDNLVTCGRNGLHRYNNQDHSMVTAILATLNVLERARHDVWSVNTEAEYLESGPVHESLAALEVVA
jgi:protoporphyrinogen oxidase